MEALLAEDIERRRRVAREALGQRLLASRYWCANGRAVSVVAVEVNPPGEYFAAYIGGGKGLVEEEDRLWVSQNGSKLVESEARAIFPELFDWGYWP